MRLSAIYEGTIFAFSKTCLYILTISTITSSIVLSVLLSLYIVSTQYSYPDIEIARECLTELPVFIMGFMSIYELSLAIGTLIAFLRPLSKLAHQSERNEETQSIMAIARKYTILTSVAAISTLGMMMLIGASSMSALMSIDFIMNITCLMLMTPYYKDQVYEKICCGIIKMTENCKCCGGQMMDVQLAKMTSHSEQTEITVTSTKSSTDSKNVSKGESQTETKKNEKINVPKQGGMNVVLHAYSGTT